MALNTNFASRLLNRTREPEQQTTTQYDDFMHKDRTVEQKQPTNRWQMYRDSLKQTAARKAVDHMKRTGIQYDPEEIVINSMLYTRDRLMENPERAQLVFGVGTIDHEKEKERIIDDVLEYGQLQPRAKYQTEPEDVDIHDFDDHTEYEKYKESMPGMGYLVAGEGHETLEQAIAAEEQRYGLDPFQGDVSQLEMQEVVQNLDSQAKQILEKEDPSEEEYKYLMDSFAEQGIDLAATTPAHGIGVDPYAEGVEPAEDVSLWEQIAYPVTSALGGIQQSIYSIIEYGMDENSLVRRFTDNIIEPVKGIVDTTVDFLTADEFSIDETSWGQRAEKNWDRMEEIAQNPQMWQYAESIRMHNREKVFENYGPVAGIALDTVYMAEGLGHLMAEMALITKLTKGTGTKASAVRGAGQLAQYGNRMMQALNRVNQSQRIPQFAKTMLNAAARSGEQAVVNPQVQAKLGRTLAHRYLTTPGELEDRAEAAAYGMLYNFTPVMARSFGKSNIPTKLIDTGLNLIISTQNEYYEAIQKHGWTVESAMQIIPALAMDIGMSLSTKSDRDIRNYRQQLINDGVPEKAAQARAQNVAELREEFAKQGILDEQGRPASPQEIKDLSNEATADARRVGMEIFEPGTREGDRVEPSREQEVTAARTGEEPRVQRTEDIQINRRDKDYQRIKKEVRNTLNRDDYESQAAYERDVKAQADERYKAEKAGQEPVGTEGIPEAERTPTAEAQRTGERPAAEDKPAERLDNKTLLEIGDNFRDVGIFDNAERHLNKQAIEQNRPDEAVQRINDFLHSEARKFRETASTYGISKEEGKRIEAHVKNIAKTWDGRSVEPINDALRTMGQYRDKYNNIIIQAPDRAELGERTDTTRVELDKHENTQIDSFTDRAVKDLERIGEKADRDSIRNVIEETYRDIKEAEGGNKTEALKRINEVLTAQKKKHDGEEFSFTKRDHTAEEALLNKLTGKTAKPEATEVKEAAPKDDVKPKTDDKKPAKDVKEAGKPEATAPKADTRTPGKMNEGLKTEGDNKEIQTDDGNTIATGYNRIVHGDRGSYIEFERKHLNTDAFGPMVDRKKKVGKGAYYDEANLKDKPQTDQTRLYKQHRPVNYADYQVGKYYIAADNPYIKVKGFKPAAAPKKPAAKKEADKKEPEGKQQLGEVRYSEDGKSAELLTKGKDLRGVRGDHKAQRGKHHDGTHALILPGDKTPVEAGTALRITLDEGRDQLNTKVTKVETVKGKDLQKPYHIPGQYKDMNKKKFNEQTWQKITYDLIDVTTGEKTSQYMDATIRDTGAARKQTQQETNKYLNPYRKNIKGESKEHSTYKQIPKREYKEEINELPADKPWMSRDDESGTITLRSSAGTRIEGEKEEAKRLELGQRQISITKYSKKKTPDRYPQQEHTFKNLEAAAQASRILGFGRRIGKEKQKEFLDKLQKASGDEARVISREIDAIANKLIDDLKTRFPKDETYRDRVEKAIHEMTQHFFNEFFHLERAALAKFNKERNPELANKLMAETNKLFDFDGALGIVLTDVRERLYGIQNYQTRPELYDGKVEILVPGEIKRDGMQYVYDSPITDRSDLMRKDLNVAVEKRKDKGKVEWDRRKAKWYIDEKMDYEDYQQLKSAGFTDTAIENLHKSNRTNEAYEQIKESAKRTIENPKTIKRESDILQKEWDKLNVDERKDLLTKMIYANREVMPKKLSGNIKSLIDMWASYKNIKDMPPVIFRSFLDNMGRKGVLTEREIKAIESRQQPSDILFTTSGRYVGEDGVRYHDIGIGGRIDEQGRPIINPEYNVKPISADLERISQHTRGLIKPGDVDKKGDPVPVYFQEYDTRTGLTPKKYYVQEVGIGAEKPYQRFNKSWEELNELERTLLLTEGTYKVWLKDEDGNILDHPVSARDLHYGRGVGRSFQPLISREALDEFVQKSHADIRAKKITDPKEIESIHEITRALHNWENAVHERMDYTGQSRDDLNNIMALNLSRDPATHSFYATSRYPRKPFAENIEETVGRFRQNTESYIKDYETAKQEVNFERRMKGEEPLEGDALHRAALKYNHDKAQYPFEVVRMGEEVKEPSMREIVMARQQMGMDRDDDTSEKPAFLDIHSFDRPGIYLARTEADGLKFIEDNVPEGERHLYEVQPREVDHVLRYGRDSDGNRAEEWVKTTLQPYLEAIYGGTVPGVRGQEGKAVEGHEVRGDRRGETRTPRKEPARDDRGLTPEQRKNESAAMRIAEALGMRMDPEGKDSTLQFTLTGNPEFAGAVLGRHIHLNLDTPRPQHTIIHEVTHRLMELDPGEKGEKRPYTLMKEKLLSGWNEKKRAKPKTDAEIKEWLADYMAELSYTKGFWQAPGIGGKTHGIMPTKFRSTQFETDPDKLPDSLKVRHLLYGKEQAEMDKLMYRLMRKHLQGDKVFDDSLPFPDNRLLYQTDGGALLSHLSQGQRDTIKRGVDKVLRNINSNLESPHLQAFINAKDKRGFVKGYLNNPEFKAELPSNLLKAYQNLGNKKVQEMTFSEAKTMVAVYDWAVKHMLYRNTPKKEEISKNIKLGEYIWGEEGNSNRLTIAREFLDKKDLKDVRGLSYEELRKLNEKLVNEYVRASNAGFQNIFGTSRRDVVTSIVEKKLLKPGNIKMLNNLNIVDYSERYDLNYDFLRKSTEHITARAMHEMIRGEKVDDELLRQLEKNPDEVIGVMIENTFHRLPGKGYNLKAVDDHINKHGDIGAVRTSLDVLISLIPHGQKIRSNLQMAKKRGEDWAKPFYQRTNDALKGLKEESLIKVGKIVDGKRDEIEGKITKREENAAQEVRKIFADLFDQGVQFGLLKKGQKIDDYLPHLSVLDKSNREMGEHADKIPHEFFSKDRHRVSKGNINYNAKEALQIYINAMQKNAFVKPHIKSLMPQYRKMKQRTPNKAKFLGTMMDVAMGKMPEAGLKEGRLMKDTINRLRTMVGKEEISEEDAAKALQHYSRLYVMAEVGKAMGFSPSTMLRNFTQQVGMIWDVSTKEDPLRGFRLKGQHLKMMMSPEGRDRLNKIAQFNEVLVDRRPTEALRQVEGAHKHMEDKFDDTPKGPVDKFQGLVDKSMFLFRHADVSNVKASHFIKLMASLEDGMPMRDAIREANEGTFRTQFDYGAGRPMIYHSAPGRMAALFHSWPTNYFNMLRDWSNQAGGVATEEFARKFAGQMATYLIIAGLLRQVGLKMNIGPFSTGEGHMVTKGARAIQSWIAGEDATRELPVFFSTLDDATDTIGNVMRGDVNTLGKIAYEVGSFTPFRNPIKRLVPATQAVLNEGRTYDPITGEEKHKIDDPMHYFATIMGMSKFADDRYHLAQRYSFSPRMTETHNMLEIAIHQQIDSDYQPSIQLNRDLLWKIARGQGAEVTDLLRNPAELEQAVMKRIKRAGLDADELRDNAYANIRRYHSNLARQHVLSGGGNWKKDVKGRLNMIQRSQGNLNYYKRTYEEILENNQSKAVRQRAFETLQLIDKMQN